MVGLGSSYHPSFTSPAQACWPLRLAVPFFCFSWAVLFLRTPDSLVTLAFCWLPFASISGMPTCVQFHWGTPFNFSSQEGPRTPGESAGASADSMEISEDTRRQGISLNCMYKACLNPHTSYTMAGPTGALPLYQMVGLNLSSIPATWRIQHSDGSGVGPPCISNPQVVGRQSFPLAPSCM